MYNTINAYCDRLCTEFDQIPEKRKELLLQLSHYITNKIQKQLNVNLVYICTHNSRRSHFGQIWAQLAASYFQLKHIHAFSGGTEETAFNVNAINALKRIGFHIKTIGEEKNPVYHLLFSEINKPIICFSKKYDHEVNPKNEFAAIMTCSDAEQNCPFIPGAELRIGTTYDDPKAFDNTPLQGEKYDERCKQIALETFFVFDQVKKLSI
ncbi:MAG: protein-tyrosine-phosphatase [Sphingobacteriaceae bacterium]|nr:protein-tyrosine-phosphatase [Sphingobacteriaceae bacterium]